MHLSWQRIDVATTCSEQRRLDHSFQTRLEDASFYTHPSCSSPPPFGLTTAPIERLPLAVGPSPERGTARGKEHVQDYQPRSDATAEEEADEQTEDEQDDDDEHWGGVG